MIRGMIRGYDSHKSNFLPLLKTARVKKRHSQCVLIYVNVYYIYLIMYYIYNYIYLIIYIYYCKYIYNYIHISCKDTCTMFTMRASENPHSQRRLPARRFQGPGRDDRKSEAETNMFMMS